MSNTDIPSTEVIRHWVAWGPEDDHSQERVDQFDAWFATQSEIVELQTRVKILEELKNQLPAFEFFEPYVGVERVIRVISGDSEETK